ncbi:MAG: hypothetical protein HY080_10480 [Gammaproteobacteria bacterium]|nr:hypothetical protein [Gammaproteobacteria bacterium]
MKTYQALFAALLLNASLSLVAVASPADIDDVTMDVVKHSDPQEITQDIKLPEAVETGEHSHDSAHVDSVDSNDQQDDMDDDMHDNSAIEEAEEHKDQSSGDMESAHEAVEQSHDGSM